MPRERKFNFVPVSHEDMRRHGGSAARDQRPYVRLQKPGQLIFPRKTLEYLDIPTTKGAIVYLRFYIDEARRAISFKIVTTLRQGATEDYRPLAIKEYTGGICFAGLGIVPLLRKIAPWREPVSCDLEEYEDSDGYLGIGKVHYFVVPKPVAPTNGTQT